MSPLLNHNDFPNPNQNILGCLSLAYTSSFLMIKFLAENKSIMINDSMAPILTHLLRG